MCISYIYIYIYNITFETQNQGRNTIFCVKYEYFSKNRGVYRFQNKKPKHFLCFGHFQTKSFFFFDKTVKQIIAFIGHLRKFLCGNIFSVFQTFFDGAIKMVFIKINIQGKKEKMY